MNLHHGDCLDVMKEMSDNSVDSIVTDPPYGLKFMSKKWDYDVPSIEIWKEALRVLKPGGHLLSFGGTRTYHRMVVNIEDAGFEIRDQIMWLYGSGFPKSHNISKAIDKKFGAEKVIGHKKDRWTGKGNTLNFSTDRPQDKCKITTPSTDLAKQYDGFGTALKPANEPIVMARKPLSEKTIVDNVLKWGTGGINIDGCRIEGVWKGSKRTNSPKLGNVYEGPQRYKKIETEQHSQGRFPANIILDEYAGQALDEQSGELQSRPNKNARPKGKYAFVEQKQDDLHRQQYETTKGGASRFFYCAKASKSERNAGLEGMESKFTATMNDGIGEREDNKDQPSAFNQNFHPTVKPIKLMKYLVRLVTPKSGTVLDPFMGSGSTGIASKSEGFDFIGIEMYADYLEIAKKRIECHSG